jgi:hypothetical protein
LSVRQVENDIELLESILADEKRAMSAFNPTARWATYSQSFVDFLRTVGLHNFRGTRHPKGTPGSVLPRFGAIDINPDPARPNGTPEEMFHAARSCFLGDGAKPIEELEASRVGNPQGFEIDGRFYTLSWLNFYCRYAFVSQHMRFSDQVLIEVGSGSGKQAEMLKKAHPDLTIVLFDLPTQLYVCNQYLSKVFEGTGHVADYRACSGVQSFSDIQKGKINILPHWKFPIVENQEFDLLWNAASFQEMGEEASRYLKSAAGAKAMFLMHNIKYRRGAEAPGDRGVISPKTLSPFREVDREVARLAFPVQTWLYFDSFWKR